MSQENNGLVRKCERRMIAGRTSAIIVQVDNPKNIQNVEDMARPNVRVGVSTLGT